MDWNIGLWVKRVGVDGFLCLGFAKVLSVGNLSPRDGLVMGKICQYHDGCDMCKILSVSFGIIVFIVVFDMAVYERQAF